MKKCTKCKKIKNSFPANKINKDGLQSWCRDCYNNYIFYFYKTKDGLVKKIYNCQKWNSKKRGHNPPEYTSKELIEWLFAQDKFHQLYDNWKASGYDTNIIPSCDRIDDNKGYSLENIQLMTWGENNRKGNDDMRAGKLINGTNPQKPVIQYDLLGNKINEFHSIKEAERQTGIPNTNISKCCRDIFKQTGAFKWSYK